ncbi:MAG: undecaprenyldiphospho-muramoylpentapeptide beta-N-acetylglucosaminyltransferase [Proteobacteria bacterium]|nr:undecaprenyldiphospho-muramoylpentapeptide beta-N-acetylglucosaminyltransferase [Pseudomonadota bacterium]
MKLIISAGGTGGHIFPGIAVAETFVAQGQDNQVAFIGTTYGLESKIIPQYGFRLLFVEARQFLGRSAVYKIATLFYILKGICTCMRVIKREKPDAILGMGGFTSVPVIFAGAILGVPVFLHEQNAEPGLANKVLSKYAKATFVSFEESSQLLKSKNVYYTGNPVRKAVKVPREIKNDETFGIFVFGGSRGAKSINESVLSLLPYMEGYKNAIIYHQTGAEDYTRLKEAYEKTEIGHEVFPFTDNMAHYYNRSDVVISRAGASTIFELAYFRKAAILIPYPFSAGQHQWKNASHVENAGGGYIIGNDEATGERLHGVIKHLMNEPVLLKQMGENIGRLYVDDAQDRIIAKMQEEVEGKRK